MRRTLQASATKPVLGSWRASGSNYDTSTVRDAPERADALRRHGCVPTRRFAGRPADVNLANRTLVGEQAQTLFVDAATGKYRQPRSRTCGVPFETGAPRRPVAAAAAREDAIDL